MSIEFRCNQCGAMLRVGDDAAGKQTRCPNCATINAVPLPEADEPLMAEPAEPASETPDSEEEYRLGPPPAETMNPYAAPYLAADAPAYADQTAGRDGPVWERVGPSAATFVETVQDIYSSTESTFSRMRVDGGHFRPQLFAVIAGLIGMMASTFYRYVVEFVRQGGMARAEDAFAGAVGIAICAPFLIVLLTYFVGGVVHGLLQLFGGSRYGYEATLRATCYTFGASYLLALIPICGCCLFWVAWAVLLIVGLGRAQEVPTGRAAGAVLVPVVLGMLAWAGLIVWTIGNLGGF